MQAQHPLSVVTPTLDGDVLTVLAQADAAFTPGQLRLLLDDYSTEGIRKVLQRLDVQGIVDAEHVGRAYQYRLNRDHLAAEPVIALANQRATLLHRITDHLESWSVRPLYGAVFGSTARGTMRPDSDIDIFLVRPDDADLDHWEQLTSELARLVTRWTGNDTRVLEMAETEVRTGADSDPVLSSIVEAGLAVAGHPLWLRQIVRRSKVRDIGARAHE
jgi:predicted nucleotidyltransferase